MGNILSYSGINTKIKAMSSKLISSKDKTTLSGIESVPEFVAFLKSHPGYKEIFENVDEHKIHRDEIEQMLEYSVYFDYAKIYKFANVKQKDFMDLHFIKYEVNILKSCMRMVFDKNKVSLDLSMFESFFTKHSKIDIVKLSNSTSIEELVSNLEGTDYYKPLIKLQNMTVPTLFDYEMQLDLYHFTSVFKNISKYLKGKDLSIITNNYGCQIDMLNIQWVYRAKKFYNIPNSDIYQLIIPISYKLTKETLNAMINAASFTDLRGIISGSYYGSLYNKLDVNSPEEFYREVRFMMHSLESKKNPYTIATINSYLFFKEREVRTLTTVLECVRYGLDSNTILSYITN